MTTAPTNIRYRIIAASMLMAFILYLDRICLGEIVKSASFKGDVALSKEQIGRILGAFFFTYALFQVPAGWASDRWGARRMLTGYIVLWSLFTGLTGFMSSFWGLMLARLGCGIAEAGAYPTSGAIIRRWIPLAGRGQASALVSLGGRIGGTLAPFLTALLIVAFGNWRPALWVDAIVGLIIAGIYFAIIRNRPSEHPGCNAAEQKLIGSPPSEPLPEAGEIGPMLRAFCLSRSLWLTSASQLFVNIGWAFLITWLPTYLGEQKHVTAVAGGRMVSLVLAFGMAGQLAGGWASDWSVRRFGLRWGRVIPMAAPLMLAGGAYLACLGVDSAWAIIACCAVVSFGTDMNNPASWAFMQDIGGKNTASAAGWANMWGNFGASVSAMMVPWLIQVGGSGEAGQRLVFIACAGAFFLAAVTVLGMDATKLIVVKSKATT